MKESQMSVRDIRRGMQGGEDGSSLDLKMANEERTMNHTEFRYRYYPHL